MRDAGQGEEGVDGGVRAQGGDEIKFVLGRQVVEMKAKEVMKKQLADFSLLDNITNNILPQGNFVKKHLMSGLFHKNILSQDNFVKQNKMHEYLQHLLRLVRQSVDHTFRFILHT